MVVDIRMPGIPNEEKIAKLAKTSNKMPIIVITTYDDKESRNMVLRINTFNFFKNLLTVQHYWMLSIGHSDH